MQDPFAEPHDLPFISHIENFHADQDLPEDVTLSPITSSL